MADIFLSYKRTDRERVGPIIRLLESCGWSVWWDTRIDAGEKWDEVIEREIDAANCVVAIWSLESVTSRWVRTEASEGLERGVLVPVFIDATRPPLEFKLVQSVDLTDWARDASSPAAQQLVNAVAKLLGPLPVRSAPGSSLSLEEDFELPRPLVVGEAEQEHWDRIWESNDQKQLRAFLAAYPTGHYARAAEARLQHLGPRTRLPSGLASSVVLGLTAGLLVIIPAVLWLSGYLGGPQTVPRPTVAEQPPAIKIAEVKRVKIDSPPKAPPPPVVRSRTEELLKQAKLRIESGDIKGAREILDAPETATSAAMTFMLAETYDPSMLAIWQARSVFGDAAKARRLYQKALALGENRAELRLRPDWLGAN